MNSAPAAFFALIVLTATTLCVPLAAGSQGGKSSSPADADVPEKTAVRILSLPDKALFLWQVGPMSVKGHATVKWGLYRDNGSFTGRCGTVGVSGSGTKATAFAGTDGTFYVLTTAK